MQYIQIVDKKVMWTGQHVAVTYDWPVISLGEEFLYASGITYLALLTTLTGPPLVCSTAEFYPTSILDAGRSNPVPTGPRLSFLSNGGPGAPDTIQLASTCYRYLRAVHIAPHQNCMKQGLVNKTTGLSLRPCHTIPESIALTITTREHPPIFYVKKYGNNIHIYIFM